MIVADDKDCNSDDESTKHMIEKAIETKTSDGKGEQRDDGMRR